MTYFRAMTEEEEKEPHCLRCGMSRKSKPYGSCGYMGVGYNRHIWSDKQPHKPPIDIE